MHREARELRANLIPVRTQTETAEEMSRIFGQKVSKQLVELWEVGALTKLLDGFRAERGLFVEPTAELDRLKARLETLKRRLEQ